MNAPNRDNFNLPEGVKKISFEEDHNIENAVTFKIEKEDHTIGNLLHRQLLKEKQIVFAGYKVKHPFEETVIVRVQTTKETTPQTMMTKAVSDLMSVTGFLTSKFTEQVEKAIAKSQTCNNTGLPNHDSSSYLPMSPIEQQPS
ncbi:5729_t:CDS:2 [Ambispora gerdemannii]|uniref:5729_t:CDS:1 n=1 Tax=Ambispora gerdemannii TaxID=144530 RepID=A0A9N8ZAL9_9GLOM|nr:5729_t:CDS:2 [Ambispora gerdemannii]